MQSLDTTAGVLKDAAQQRDMDLIAAARAGSMAAFSELYSVYARVLYRRVFSITRNHEDAEDAMQETMMPCVCRAAHVRRPIEVAFVADAHCDQFGADDSAQAAYTRRGAVSAHACRRRGSYGLGSDGPEAEPGGSLRTGRASGVGAPLDRDSQAGSALGLSDPGKPGLVDEGDCSDSRRLFGCGQGPSASGAPAPHRASPQRPQTGTSFNGRPAQKRDLRSHC